MTPTKAYKLFNRLASLLSTTDTDFSPGYLEAQKYVAERIRKGLETSNGLQPRDLAHKAASLANDLRNRASDVSPDEDQHWALLDASKEIDRVVAYLRAE